MNSEIKEIYIVPQAKLFMYASRASMNPNDLIEKIKMTHDDLYPKLGGYALDRKQYFSLLYLAGVKKTKSYLEKDKAELLKDIETSELIAELEKRTRG